MPTRETGGGQSRSGRRTDRTDRTEEHGEAPAEGTADPAAQERHGKLSEDVDAILDEIDETLEENAEEFVKGFVQKGGQ